MDLENYALLYDEVYEEEHKIYRQAFRRFCELEIVPFQEEWEEQGVVPRELWAKAGANGFLCPQVAEQYGGLGADFRYAVINIEELARVGHTGFFITLHNDVIAPYIEAFGSEEQKRKWLPRCISGETITAIDMTEPGTGSDLAAIRTTALRDGDGWVLNGQKTFISNGLLCDLAIVAAKTDPKADPHAGVSLFLVEADRPGFSKGKKLKKIGLRSQDTAEHFFEDCRIPLDNILGDENAGFLYLMQKLQQERLVVAVGSQAGAERVLDMTIAYTKERSAFGKPISKFQNTQFKLVECATQVQIGRTFIDKLIREHMAGKQIIKETCMAKYWNCEMFQRVTDVCLQLHGGYGFMSEYPVSKAFIDGRVQTIYAGTSEIMKIIVAKQMGL